VLETNAWSQGQGSPNPAIPAALKEWSIPIDQLPPEGRKLYEPDPDAARRLLAEAGHPRGLKVPVETTAGYGPDYMDAVEVALRNWKSVGVETDLKLKEYGAFVSSTIFGKFDKLAVGLRGATTDVHSYFQIYLPGAPLNAGGVNDPKLTQAHRDDSAAAANLRRRQAAGDRLRHPALRFPARLLPLRALGERGGSLEALRQELQPQHRPRRGGRLMVAWLDK
jgi:ABC-type transport system substrate-binding protein